MTTGNGLTRRTFLYAGLAAGGGLIVGACWRKPDSGREAAETTQLNLFVEISPEGRVTIVCPVPEIGQGVRTALPMIVAEELRIAWAAVDVRQAEADPAYGPMTVGGSDSVHDYWEPLRWAGAAAREMLREAAARRWGVPTADCDAEAGEIVHRETGRRLTYGDLATTAATLDPPQEPPLTDLADFRLIGKPQARIDLRPIVTGGAEYGVDVRRPGMVYAVIARPPARGAEIRSMAEHIARRIPGVRDVVRLRPWESPSLYGSTLGGVAVVADDTWSAIQGREALAVEWDETRSSTESSASIRRRLHEAAARPGRAVRDQGDFGAVPRKGDLEIEAQYELPMLAHACMEPMSFTAEVAAGRCRTWGPTQNPRSLQASLVEALGIAEERVEVHPTLEGGGFGRRLAWDYGVEAALLARHVDAPVQVFWTREDDVRHDLFRPPSFHHLRAVLDQSGRVRGWFHHLVTASLSAHIVRGGIDRPEIYDVEGAVDLPYEPDAFRFEYSPIEVDLRLGSWRSVAQSFNGFAVNSFVDEIAERAGVDPLDMHRRLLGPDRVVQFSLPLPGRRGNVRCDTGRMRRVLEVAAEAGGWHDPRPEATGRGIACCRFKDTYTAAVAEVGVPEPGHAKVRRVAVAVDCGVVVNPDGVAAQVEGAVADAVASVLHWEVRVDQGRVVQSNFHDLPLLRLADAPEVEVRIVPSDTPPSGMGEPPYPPVPPAIANAIFDATGERVRSLPYRSPAA